MKSMAKEEIMSGNETDHNSRRDPSGWRVKGVCELIEKLKGLDILHSVRFDKFGLAATLPNRSSSSPFPRGEGPPHSECRASIWLCLAESKFTKPSCAPYNHFNPVKF